MQAHRTRHVASGKWLIIAGLKPFLGSGNFPIIFKSPGFRNLNPNHKPNIPLILLHNLQRVMTHWVT